MSGHTPGPWRVIPANEAIHPWVVGYGEGDSICDCAPPGPWISDDTADANARLIAAAPELLEQLEAMIERFHGYQGMDFLGARAAIAKARGKE